MMWWAVCCVMLVAGSVCLEAAPTSDMSHPIDWTQLELSPDDEIIEYAVSPGRYQSVPWLYMLGEAPRDSQVKNGLLRSRRTVYVSVNPAVELLQRSAYNNYMERKAHANRDFLNCIGKRGSWSNPDCKINA